MDEPGASRGIAKPYKWLALGACGLGMGAVALGVATIVVVTRAGSAEAKDVAACECEVAAPEAVASPSAVPGPPPGPPSMSDHPHIGQSLGAPWSGALTRPKRLEPGAGYFVRNSSRAYGTDAVVDHLQQVVEEVRKDRPKVHRLVIGDLSAEVGGFLPGHFSHQSGRDVDIGLYYRVLPPGFPRRFAPGTKDNLDFPTTLALLRALARTADEPTGIEWILLDYELQRMLHKFASTHGVEAAELERLFQYPHGPNAKRGLVRHFPKHRNHLHVRFRCDPASTTCKPTPGGPKSALSEDSTISDGVVGGTPVGPANANATGP